jgi:hypothetical protein
MIIPRLLPNQFQSFPIAIGNQRSPQRHKVTKNAGQKSNFKMQIANCGMALVTKKSNSTQNGKKFSRRGAELAEKSSERVRVKTKTSRF